MSFPWLQFQCFKTFLDTIMEKPDKLTRTVVLIVAVRGVVQLFLNFIMFCNRFWISPCYGIVFWISPYCANVCDFWNWPKSSSILFCAWTVNVFHLGSLLWSEFHHVVQLFVAFEMDQIQVQSCFVHECFLIEHTWAEGQTWDKKSHGSLVNILV